MRSFYKQALVAALMGAVAIAPLTAATTAPAESGNAHKAVMTKPTETMTLSIGSGQMVTLPQPISDIFVADPARADVQVRSQNKLYVFGKSAGETAVYATDKSGKVVWSSIVRIGSNITSVGTMLKLAMPDAAITATTMNGIVLLTGTVAAPSDIEEAQKLVEKFVGEGAQVVNRLKSATPLQVTLRVKIVEVSRELSKAIGVNLLSRDRAGGDFLFGVSQGNAGTISNYTDPNTGFVTRGPEVAFTPAVTGTSLGFAKRFFGLDLIGTLDLAEADGLVTTLAEPNLTTMSGETASFLAGGEIPIPLSSGLGNVSVEFKQYGVSLSFTPTVLSDGRISLRVRPEVSQISSVGSVKIGSISIPGITTRRAETTVELGSGQAFMIGGLLSNTQNNAIDKAPFLGDLPVLGSLFRSTSFKRSETELMIIVTPYLVRPVSPARIAMPNDGMRAPTDAERIIGGQTFMGKSGEKRPMPMAAPPRTIIATDRTSKADTKTAPKTASIPDAGFTLN